MLYLQTYDDNNPQKIDLTTCPPKLGGFDLDNPYFYIQFSGPNSFRHFPISDIVPAETLNNIKQGSTYLVLDNALEYFYESVDAIYSDVVDKEGINPRQIIFITGVPTMMDYVENFCNKKKVDQIKVTYFSLFELTGRDTFIKSMDAKTLEKKRKFDKKFLNLNRRWRWHRPLLVTLLEQRGLLDQGYVSLAKADDNKGWAEAWSWLSRYYANHKVLGNIFGRKVKELPDMYLDQQDLVTNRANHERSINEYYERTYFSVITETTYHENIPFLSEKIFKAIAMGHPFIIAGSPNTLTHLKNLGYMTYDSIIDESYDTILNHGDRMLAIVDEIERLCNLDKAQFKSWMSKARPIAEHNKLILKRRKKLVVNMN
jgi:hypothetical protein